MPETPGSAARRAVPWSRSDPAGECEGVAPLALCPEGTAGRPQLAAHLAAAAVIASWLLRLSLPQLVMMFVPAALRRSATQL